MPNLELVGLELTYNPRGEQQAAAGLRRLLDLADKTEQAYKRLNGITDGNAGKALVAGVKQSIVEQGKLDKQLQAERIKAEKQTSLALLALKRQEMADIARMERQQFAESQRLQRLKLQEAGKNARVSQLGQLPSSGGGGFGVGLGGGAAIGALALGAAAVKSATELESLTIGLRTVTGSAAETEAQLKRLEILARAPGLGFPEVVRGSISLQAAGLNAQLAERSIAAFGNALVSVGKGKAELDGVGLALTQIISKGKISAEEINQIAERVPQARKAIEAAFGTSNTEILQKQNISAQRFIEGLITQLEKLPKATGGAQTSFENLSDTANRSLARLGAPILQVLVPALDALVPKVEVVGKAFASMDAESQKAAIALGILAVGAAPASRAIVGLSGAITATSAAITGAGGLTAAMAGLNPVTLALGGIAIAGTAIWYDYARGVAAARAEIDQAAARASGARKLLTGEDSRTQTLSNGQNVTVLPGSTTIDTTGLPKINLGTNPLKPAPTAPKPPTLPKSAGGRVSVAKQLTEAQQLTKQIAELAKESAFLRNETSAEYQLRVKLYNAQETKSELEDLFKLRRQFGFDGNLGRLQGLAEFDRLAKSSKSVSLAVEPNEFVVKLLASQAQAADDAAAAIERRNRALDARADIAGSALDLDRERVQTRLTAGLITESQARREIVALEQRHRTEIIASLEARKTAAGITQAEIAALDVQIERARQLGVVLNANLSARQSFFKGLFDVQGTFKEDTESLGRDIQGIFRNSISTGIREGGKEGLASFLDGLSGRLADFAADTITRNIFGALGGARTPGFNPNAQGGTGGGGGIGGFFGKIGGLLGIGGGSTAPGASPVESRLDLLYGQAQGQTRLLEIIAQNTANSVACCQQSQANAARSQNTSGLSKALGIAGSIAGILGTVAGLGAGLKGGGGSGGSGDLTRVSFESDLDRKFTDGLNSYLTNRLLPGRANGGSVFAGSLYQTHGLRDGREFFVPSNNGTVINQEQLQAVVAATNRPNAPVINITLNAGGNGNNLDARRTADQIAAAVRESLTRTERNQ